MISDDLFDTNLEKILEFFQLEKRKLRSDILNESDIKNIHNGWVQMTQVSPNQNDLCRFYKLVSDGEPQRYETNQIHYNYNTIEDIKDHINKTCATSYSAGSVYLNKPYYVKEGKIDTCLCEKCENMNEYIKCILNNKKKLNKPYIKWWAVDRLRRFCRAWAFSRRVSKGAISNFIDCSEELISWYKIKKIVSLLYLVSKVLYEPKYLVTEICKGG